MICALIYHPSGEITGTLDGMGGAGGASAEVLVKARGGLKVGWGTYLEVRLGFRCTETVTTTSTTTLINASGITIGMHPEGNSF